MPKFFTILDISPNVTKFVKFFTIFLIYTQLSSSQGFDYGNYFGPHFGPPFGPPFGFTNTDTNYSAVPLSTPDECARECRDNEPPKNCYYRFHIEFYTTLGPACNVTGGEDQCILADGVERTLMPISRRLPGPPIEVCLNDRVIVDVENAAAGMEVTIHWHGIFQNGYQYYDGVPYLTQCPIASSSTFRYDFVVQNSGTHFYHSHVHTHMLDGQVGSFIVKDLPFNSPNRDNYDIDEPQNYVIFITDWMHELSLERYPGFYLHDLGQTARNFLINGLGSFTDSNNVNNNAKLAEFTVQSGKRYRMRLINSFSTVCLAELSIEGHSGLMIIAQDGANVKPRPVDKIVTSTGERVDFVLNANQSVGTYWIILRGLGECADTTLIPRPVVQTAILRYEGGPQKPTSPVPTESPSGVVYNGLDATKCDTSDTSTVLCVNQLEGLSIDPDLMKVEPDELHILPFYFYNYSAADEDKQLFATDTYNTFFDANDRSQLLSIFNDVAYETPSSPLISQQSAYRTICRKNQLSNCTQPCTCSQVISTKLNNVVELLMYDKIPVVDLHHPFHLHGYEFRVFSIGQFTDSRNISRADINQILAEHRQRLQNGQYTIPPGKDTVKIPYGGWVIVRFKATNPGWWLLHCHFSWHHITGMELVIRVGDDNDLPPPPTNFPQCNNWRPPIETLNHFYGPQFSKLI